MDSGVVFEVVVMVDAIKARPVVNGTQAAKQATLRTSFENLSSGLKVAETVAKDQFVSTRRAEAGSADKANGGDKKVERKVDRALNSLKDAVSLSSKVLEHLDQVSNGDGDNSDSSDPIRELARDLDQVRQDVSQVLKQLRERHAHAQVLKENIDSAASNPEDLTAAQARAENISLQVVDGDTSLVDAHDISPERVASLLAD